RKQGGGPPGVPGLSPAAAAPPAPVGERLPLGLRRTLARELCPGESVERGLLPPPAAMAPARRRTLIQFGIASALVLVCILVNFSSIVFWPGLWSFSSLVQWIYQSVGGAGGGCVL